MSEHYFTCPECGGHYFGRDVGKVDGKLAVLETVRCHGNGSDNPVVVCNWRGVWPPKGEGR